jgi:hypothetical protein
MLSVTIPDLKRNSQDTSAFYLENIYQIFANTNASGNVIPATLAKPPAFSPPRYAIWVNSLWLLALLISLSGALWAIFLQGVVIRSNSVTQDSDHSPERRARVHAHVSQTLSGFGGFRDNSVLPFCLNLSFFLFITGVLIYFFNINRATFGAVVWWIITITMLYALFTFTSFSPDELWYTPFSSSALRLYLASVYAVYHIFSWIKPLHSLSNDIKEHYSDLSGRYDEGFIEGKIKWADEMASKPSSAIDSTVLERILRVLHEDHALERLFNALPGFCASNLVQIPLQSQVVTKLQQSLDGFLDRTFSSHLVAASARNDRLITCLNAAHAALGPIAASKILRDFFNRQRDEAMKSVEIGHSLINWNHGGDSLINTNVRRIVSCIIASVQNRNDRWTMLVKEVFKVPDGVFRDYLAHGDSVLLAILTHVTREALLIGRSEQLVLEKLSQFDIHNTAVELQHKFCALWNEVVQEARNDGFGSTPTQILAGIRHLFVTLHRGTDAAPNQFPAPLDSIDDSDAILRWPSLYPSCNIPGHHPDSTAQGLPIATAPESIIRRHSEPAIGLSVVQRPQSSLRLRRTQSCSHSPTVPLPTRPSHPPITSPRPGLVSQPPLTNSPDVVTKHAMPDVADISSMSRTADLIHGSSSSSGPAVQQVEETRTTSHSVALGSLPTPLPTPALGHSAISAMLPSSIDPVATQSNFLHHPPGAPTLTTTPLSPQAATLSDQSPGAGRDREQGDIQDSRPLTPRVDHGQPPSSGTTIP